MAYAASKVQGCYGTVLRVLSEVLSGQCNVCMYG